MPSREETSAIEAALVRRLIAAQFPEWANLPIRPVIPGGWDNRTFRLGEHMSVRLPSGPAYVAQVEKEHRWLPLSAAADPRSACQWRARRGLSLAVVRLPLA